MSREIPRRTVLKGLGATVALPLMEGMASAAAAGAAQSPLRLGAIFLPNGMWMDDFTPKREGAGYDLPPTLAPLAKVKERVNILSGLALDNARAKGDGPGDHARSAAAFLTGAHPYKTAGSDIRAGVSMDQVAAQHVGRQTRLPSLEVGLDKAVPAGSCDSGYACAYVSNISWRSENAPMPKEIDPSAVFDRLFGTDSTQRLAERRSILDYVAEDARSLQRQLGSADQRKLDEFSTSIREIERRVEKSQRDEQAPRPADAARPGGIPKEFAEHMKLMADMVVLAFQMDLTRVCTFMVARDGSDRRYSWLGVGEGHHTVSHHGRDDQKVAAIRRIDRFHVEQIAYFLERLQSVKEGEGTLLDQCMIVAGSGIGDGDRHNHDELPILLAGRAGGAIPSGRHARYPRNTPLCNLYLAMLNLMGAPVTCFGDSTGPLKLPVA